MNIPPTLRRMAVPIDDLTPFEKNPRQGDIGAIVTSLERNGQYRPIVVNKRDNVILAGNHTWWAAKQLEWPKIAATFVNVDDATAKRIVLVDNRANDLASYDDQALIELLQAIATEEGPEGLVGTGFDGDDLDELLAEFDPDGDGDGGGGSTSGDTEPIDPPEEPRTKLGDLYTLGDHRLLCGDSTDRAVVERLLDGAAPDLLVTDPPYGVSYESIGRALANDKYDSSRNAKGPTKQHAPIANDSLTPEATRDLFAAALTASGLPAGASFYATVPAGPLQRWFMEAVECALGNGALRQGLTWVKDSLVMGRSDYHYRHEAILYGWAPGEAHSFIDDRTQDSVWEIARPKRSDEHPTMKPVELYEKCVVNSSQPRGIAYDPFAGSGPLALACENQNRQARLIELDPGYCDVIVDRWGRHTGKTAKRERRRRS